MPISYDKLCKMLIDEKMNWIELKNVAGMSSSIVAEWGRNEFVLMESLCKICLTLKCNMGNSVDIIPESICSQNDLDNIANKGVLNL